MNNNWQRVKLDDVCDLIAGFAFKGKDFGEEFQSKVIKIADIQPPNVKMDSLTGIDVSKYDESKLQKYRVGIGDYVFAMTGATIGKLGRIQEGEAYINQRVLTFRNNLNVCDKDFLYYVLAQPSFLGYILNHIDSETAQPNISASSVGTFEFYLPPISTQKQIANALRGLDDKIELNNKINRNLEAQAQAIFKSWFIDFEPFKDGKFIDSELGKIPEGWKVESIYSISEVIYGAPFSSNLFNNKQLGTPIIRIRDLPNEASNTYTTESHPKGYLIKQGDIVVGMDGEFKAYLWGGDNAWLNQRICVFKSKLNVSTAFVMFSIVPLLNEVESSELATTVIHLGKNDIDRFKIILPKLNILKEFNRISIPILTL